MLPTGRCLPAPSTLTSVRTCGAGAAPEKASEAEFSPNRFARRYQRRRRLNKTGASAFFTWVLCCAAYMGLRIVKTLGGLGPYLPYGVFVLFVEMLGASATGIYGAPVLYAHSG